ncbi:ABC transporter permease [Nitratifractor sp.]
MTRSLLNRLTILKLLIKKDWAVKYKGTFLGYLWSIAHPLMLTAIFYIAFGIVAKMPIPNFVLFLALGLFPWQWYSNSIFSGLWAFKGNSSLIKKTIFPRYLLPLSNVMVDMIHFILSIPILLVLLYLYNQPLFHWSWIVWIPILIFIQTVLTFSITLVFATLNLFLRDIERLVNLLITFQFYLTPIFYSKTMIPKDLQSYFYFNPMMPLVSLWREVFFGKPITYTDFWILVGEAAFLFLVSFIIYRRLEPKFAEQV